MKLYCSNQKEFLTIIVRKAVAVEGEITSQ